jgi:hypothetical protein
MKNKVLCSIFWSYPLKYFRRDYSSCDNTFNTISFRIVCTSNIKLNEKSDESVTKQAVDNNNTWENLDLAKLESEVFVIGIWKSYGEMEDSISMPELMATLSTKRDLDYQEKKFLAAIQGVDIEEGKKEDAWEEMKKRVLYKGKDSSDITNLKGKKAIAAGFGIGMGLDYEEVVG